MSSISFCNTTIIFTTFVAGKEHDFHLFKQSKVKLKKEMECLADKGYQGIQKLHPNSQLPKKKHKGKQLSQLDRENNQSPERTRGICERIIGRPKVFKILAFAISKLEKTIWVEIEIAGLYNYGSSVRMVITFSN